MLSYKLSNGILFDDGNFDAEKIAIGCFDPFNNSIFCLHFTNFSFDSFNLLLSVWMDTLILLNTWSILCDKELKAPKIFAHDGSKAVSNVIETSLWEIICIFIIINFILYITYLHT